MSGGTRTAGVAARASLADRAARIAAGWAPTIARVLLGLTLAWFGYHELMTPQLWTGYVPGVSATSDVGIALVLAHGWLLLVLAVAITAAIGLRLAAAVSALLLLQIVLNSLSPAGSPTSRCVTSASSASPSA
jgi:hypothetical protein